MLSDQATFLLGVKNEQWGPAESFSPTNKIFRETILEKDPFYESMGLYVARLNLALPWDLTLSFLAEISEVPGREKQIQRSGDEEFVAKGLARIEWNHNADSVALVAGNTERGEAWVGEYASVRFFDQLTFYGEARHERSSRAWYPVRNNALVVFEQKKK